MVVKVENDKADVKYIIGGRTEKDIFKKRIVTIPMPYRGTQATTRSTSSTHKPKASVANVEAVQNHHPFRSMTNALQCLKYGLQTTSNNPSRRHEKEGWMRIEVIMSIISLCERVVQRTRSIEMELFASLAESTRADSCRI